MPAFTVPRRTATGRTGPPWRRRRRAEEAAQAVRDARLLLRHGRCAVCRERDESARRWLTFFVADTHSDAGVMARVTDSVGLCPAHTRRLLADASAPWLLPQVHRAALRGAERLLAEGASPARCPACAAGAEAERRALSVLLRAAALDETRDEVGAATVCVPHLASLAAHAWTDVRRGGLLPRTPTGLWRSRAVRRVLFRRVPARAPGVPTGFRRGPVARADAAGAALRLAASASDGLREAPVEPLTVAGTDPDAEPRARRLARLDRFLPVEERQQRDSVTARWEGDLETGSCPLCLAEQRAVRRLLNWLATSTGRGGPGPEERGLCPAHLYDIAAIGGPGVPAVLSAARDLWLGRLARFRELSGQSRRERRTAADALAPTAPCRACTARTEAGLRQLALMTAELRDPVRVRSFEGAHGVCLRHALVHGAALPPVARTLAHARLAQLRWEVDEALREQEWRTRHEVRGAETTVGRRAAALLDGRVWAGLPPPAIRAARDTHPQEPHDESVPVTRRTQWSSM